MNPATLKAAANAAWSAAGRELEAKKLRELNAIQRNNAGPLFRSAAPAPQRAGGSAGVFLPLLALGALFFLLKD